MQESKKKRKRKGTYPCSPLRHKLLLRQRRLRPIRIESALRKRLSLRIQEYGGTGCHRFNFLHHRYTKTVRYIYIQLKSMKTRKFKLIRTRVEKRKGIEGVVQQQDVRAKLRINSCNVLISWSRCLEVKKMGSFRSGVVN